MSRILYLKTRLYSIFDLRSSNSPLIHQFYYSALTQLRSKIFSICLDDKSQVGTPASQKFALHSPLHEFFLQKENLWFIGLNSSSLLQLCKTNSVFFSLKHFSHFFSFSHYLSKLLSETPHF